MAVRDTLAKMAMPNSRNKPQPSSFFVVPSSELEEKQNGRRKADAVAGKVIRVKEQAFERTFINSQPIASAHKLNTGGQLCKWRHGDKQPAYEAEKRTKTRCCAKLSQGITNG